MQGARSFYEVLGVATSASEQQITLAYRTLAMKLHPDRNSSTSAHAEFVQMAEAYSVLKDAARRAAYDRQIGLNGRYHDPAGRDRYGHGGASGGPGPFDFDEQFRRWSEAGFRERQQQTARDDPWSAWADPDDDPPPPKARDLTRKITITFAEQIAGCFREIRLTRSKDCATCDGMGGVRASPQRCELCKGSGRRGRYREWCYACDGTGTTTWRPCTACRGTSKTTVKRKLKVTIPAGLGPDSEIRLKGEGALGRDGAPNGDLYVRIELEEDPFFVVREFPDLLLTVPISMFMAIGGGDVSIPTLDGATTITVSAGRNPERLGRLQGEGLLNADGTRGSLFVQFVVHPVPNPSAEIVEGMQRFEGLRRKTDKDSEMARWERDVFAYLRRHHKGKKG